MVSYYINEIVQLTFASLLLIIVTFLLAKGVREFHASNLWKVLLAGIWLSYAVGVIAWTTAIITWSVNISSLLGAIVISVCNSVGMICTTAVHWVFTFKYWAVARKLQQIKQKGPDAYDNFNYKLWGLLGLILNILFSLWFTNYIKTAALFPNNSTVYTVCYAFALGLPLCIFITCFV